ncbi:hypothetical protein QFC22_005265 [Naganishia vaughanmartiniae]|uniref:Uncharacterized protein n=1 Tax=Naganishia vaughanmartiniae TaxID=1424756 RepID=A0ACC2WV53_9TREE|nr:hypothetical protein QFC22_005265 [Naganishia vaughanmartiniae]
MPFGQSATSTPSASTPATSNPQNRYRNIRYKSDIYVEDVPSESYTRDAKDFKVVSDENEAIVIDNGTSHLRAGFASHSQPYINEPNQAAKFTSRKSVRTVMYGRDCEVDNTAKGYIKPIFDGDILLTNELLVGARFDFVMKHAIPHPIIMTERLASPLYSRSITSELLFEAYSVPSVTYGVDSLFAFEGIQARRKGLLSTVGQSRSNSGRSTKRGQHGAAFRESAAAGESGLVINMGNMSTTLIPILNGKSMMNRAKRIPWGGSQASDLTLRLMQLKYPGFPMRVSPRQASVDYEAELSTLSSPSVMAKESTSVQFPYPVPDVVHRSEEELAALAEKRKEQGKKLQEITQKRNREKVSAAQSDLLGLKDVLDSKANMTEEEFEDALFQVGYQNEQELVGDVKDLERKVKAARQRAGEMEEIPSFPLANVPDSELDAEQKLEKRKQRMLKASYDSRIKAKAEKQAEKERLGEIERKDGEARDTDFQGWADKLKLDHAATMTRMRERKKRKALLTNRKSAAAQGRMKQISDLAADTPVKGRKRQRGGDGDMFLMIADDDFGADDDDWAVYREIDGAEEVDEEAVDQDHLQEIEARLLKYDPSFTVEDTMEAIANRQSALVHAFLRGNEVQRGVSPKSNGYEAAGADGAEDDARSISLDMGNGIEGANQYQQQEEELARAYRLHLNVEKIRIPEVWFQPSIAGVDCAGIAELAGYMLNSFGEEDKKMMMQCIYVTGGCSLIPNIKARLERDLTSVLPFRAPLNVITDNSIPSDWPIATEWPTDPRLSAWQGMAHWARTEESQKARVSRADWEECGGSWLKEHRWSNWWDEGHYVD